LINEAVILKQATVVPMRSPKQLIEKIRFANRVLRSGSEATALLPAERAVPNLGKVELDAQLFKAEVRLNNEILEDSIERGQLRQTIMQLMAEAIARDVDEVIIQGEKGSPDTFLGKLDGILKQAKSNIVDAQLQTLNKGVLRDMLKTLPRPFVKNKKLLRYFTSVNAELDYKDSLSERATAIGDRYVEEDLPATYSGVPILDVPMFPEAQGAAQNATSILLTDPKNINVGIWRNIRVEVDKIVTDGVLVIVATLRFDVKYAEETAVVKGVNLKVAA
jgi:HK97 family phage major capsid protein